MTYPELKPEIQLSNLRNHMEPWCVEDLTPDQFVEVYIQVAKALLKDADVECTADYSDG